MSVSFSTDLCLPLDDVSRELPQYVRLFRAFQHAIVSGTLPAGAKLPASRMLSAQLGISRNTVKAAYEMLLAEGYVETRHGAGSFVAKGLPLDQLVYTDKTCGQQQEVAQKRSAMSAALLDVRSARQAKSGALLQPAQPCIRSFPWNQWQRAVARAGREMKHQQNSVMGNHYLREQIASYLRMVRGVKCTPDQVMICSGSQQAMFLVLKLLVDPGEPVITENPGYHGVDGAIAAVGAIRIPAAVDEHGIQLESGLQQAPEARVVMLTPSRNHPLGHTLSLERRLQLLQWAKRSGSWLIEDDYDSDFRFEQQPLTSLQGLGGEDVVIYTGTFSRILHPAIRLGYMVLPEPLLESAIRAKTYMEGGTTMLPQLALAGFMASGHFASHVRRMRNLYRSRRGALQQSIESRISGLLTPIISDGGMHTVYLLPAQWDDRRIRALCDEYGLGIRELSGYYAGREAMSGLVIGFAGYTEAEIDKGVGFIASAIDRYRQELRGS